MPAKRKATDSPGTPSKRVRKVLTLAHQVQVIDAVNNGLNHVQAASKFNCGMTQIANIKTNKTAISDAYTNGRKSSSKYLHPKSVKNTEIDRQVWEFFVMLALRTCQSMAPFLSWRHWK